MLLDPSLKAKTPKKHSFGRQTLWVWAHFFDSRDPQSAWNKILVAWWRTLSRSQSSPLARRATSNESRACPNRICVVFVVFVLSLLLVLYLCVASWLLLRFLALVTFGFLVLWFLGFLDFLPGFVASWSLWFLCSSQYWLSPFRFVGSSEGFRL